MNSRVWILSLVVFFSLFGENYSQQFRKIENNAFGVGEKLTFDVKFGFVTAGIATMQIPSTKE